MAVIKKSKKPSYEEAIEELESIVARLESDDITLDESLSLYTRGVELTGICNKTIDEIEGKIVKLVEDVGGVTEGVF